MALDTPSLDGTAQPPVSPHLNAGTPMPASIEPAPGARLACATLVVLAVLLPWFFGGVLRVTRQLTLVVGLTAVGLAYLSQLRARALQLPSLPVWPLAGLLALGGLQLLPLPPTLHALLAPGSHAVWHPASSAAAAVLDDSWRPLSLDPGATRESFAFAGMLGLLTVLAAPALASRGAAWAAALVVALGGTAVGIFAVATRTAFGPLLYGHIAVPTVNPYGPFVNKNHFAGYVAMTALLAAGVCLGLKEDGGRRAPDGDWRHGPRAGLVLTSAAAALAGALAVLVSLSRGGSLGLAAGAALFAALHVLAIRSRRGARQGRRLIAFLGAGVLLLIVAALVVLPMESRQRLQSVSLQDASTSFRIATWTGSLRMFKSSPLAGYGYGAFEAAYPPFKRGLGEFQVQHPENQALELLVEGGLLALLLVLAALRFLADAAVAGSRQRGEPLRRGLVTGAAAGLTALVVQDAVDFNLHVPSNACVFAFLVAVVASASGVRRQTGVRTMAGVGVALVAIVLAAAAGRNAPPRLAVWQDSAQRAAGLRGERRLRLERTEAGLTAYLQGKPGDAHAWLLLGWARLAAGDHASARTLLEHARALDPANPHVAARARELAP